ncbi:serine/threonine-protein kinase pim-2-like [Enoplosus armatus]|uniref:serine/threonine-protein kinase pim-2-like n=1 Tax=Enoplosus armatus TaxID=215367 RepID=UPI003994D007
MDVNSFEILHSLDFENDSEISSSNAEPNNGMGEDCRVTRGKRKASNKPESPRKRQRRTSGPTEVAVEAVTAKGAKRKASTERESPSKKQRGHSNSCDISEPSGVAVEDVTSSCGPSTSNQNDGSSSYSARTSRANFEAKYLQLDKLGEGGFGSVYAGCRKMDNLPVAIKHIPKADVESRSMVLNGKTYTVPLEVLLMLSVAHGPEESAAVSLLDWYDLDQEVLLVMERPASSVDLLNFLNDNGGPVEEDQAKNIMKQLVKATIQMHSEGVFHRDIKAENVLIETCSDVPRVRVIDFGCGCFAKKGSYSDFSGTSAYAPPEFYIRGKYKTGPTTVWQLGALLYELLEGYKQFTTTMFLRRKMQYSCEMRMLKVSRDCLDFLQRCLVLNPMDRITLEQMQRHPWLN